VGVGLGVRVGVGVLDGLADGPEGLLDVDSLGEDVGDAGPLGVGAGVVGLPPLCSRLLKDVP
jgi:hypothetical protein